MLFNSYIFVFYFFQLLCLDIIHLIILNMERLPMYF